MHVWREWWIGHCGTTLQCQRYFSKISIVKKKGFLCKSCLLPNPRLLFLDSVYRNSRCKFSCESMCKWTEHLTVDPFPLWCRFYHNRSGTGCIFFVHFNSRSSIFIFLTSWTDFLCNAGFNIWMFFLLQKSVSDHCQWQTGSSFIDRHLLYSFLNYVHRNMASDVVFL